jgi:two-component system LytT family response regulator
MKVPWRALIVDDERPARQTLQVLLARHPGFVVAAEADHAAAAIDAIRRESPDVLFVDVQMPGATGFDVLKETGLDAVPIVVFTTAYAEYALPAFEAHAFDYLLKPFSDERFDDVMTRIGRALAAARPASLSSRPRSLTVRDGGRVLVIPVQEIDWIEAEDYCTRIHAGARRPLIRRSMQALLEDLEADGFVRVHRSSIVNVARVREVRSIGSGDAEAVLADGTVVRVSRALRPALEQRIRR